VLSDDPQFSQRFYRQALANEILLRPIGNTVYFMPPYVISAAECEFLVDARHRRTGRRAALMIWDELQSELDALQRDGLRRTAAPSKAPADPQRRSMAAR
jgi:hypothetical protein